MLSLQTCVFMTHSLITCFYKANDVNVDFNNLYIRVRLMSESNETSLIFLKGQSALSDFRQKKLCNQLSTTEVTAHYIYILEVSPEWEHSDKLKLDKLLGTNTESISLAKASDLYIVTPRIGTISPWSSKATDITGLCGLTSLLRVERGIIYRISGEREHISSVIHDRMTESVLDSTAASQQLFQHQKKAGQVY